MIALLQRLRQIDISLAQSGKGTLLLVPATAVLFCLWLVFPANLPLEMPDTTSYIRFDAYRGAGYPFFLSLTWQIGLEWSQVIVVQLVLFFSSLLFLVFRFQKFTSSCLSALFLTLGIGANPVFVQYCFTLITEALFFSSLMVLIGLLLHRSKYSVSQMAGIGGMLAWLILIKPVAWAFICIPVLLIWQSWLPGRSPLKNATSLIVGFGLIFYAGSAYRYTIHQAWTPGSFFGVQIIGKLAFAEFDPERTPYPDAAKRWLELMAPVHSARTQSMKSIDEKFLFSLNVYDYLRFRKMPEILAKGNIPKTEEGPALNRLAYSIIAQTPIDYLEDVSINLVALWKLSELQFQKPAIAYNAKLDQLKKTLPEEIQPYRLSGNPNRSAWIIKPFLVLVFVINCLTILYGLRKLLFDRQPMNSLWGTLFIVAAAVQCYFLLTALMQAGLTRYAIAAWPLHLILILGVVIELLDKYLLKDERINNTQ